jgi:hypothetical protein
MRYIYILGIVVLAGVYFLTSSSEPVEVEKEVTQEKTQEKKTTSNISFDNKEPKKEQVKKEEKNSISNEQAKKIAQILKGNKDEPKEEKPEKPIKEEETKEAMSKADRAFEMIQEKGLIEFNQDGYIGGVSKHMVYTDFDPDEVEVNPDMPPAIPVMINGTDMKGIPFKVPVDANLYKYAQANGKKIYIGVTGTSDQVEDLIPVETGSSSNNKQVDNMPPMPPSN